MIILFGVGVYVVTVHLEEVTHHDDFVEVPDLKGFHYTEVDGFLADKDITYEISDSIFDANQPRGVVIEQNPLEGKMVKPGRKIYITVNSVTPPSVFLPELRDYTVRQVVMKIETYGLKIDSLIYKPAECDNCVVGVLYKGKETTPGMRIEKGESLTLIVGEGIGTERVNIPILYGKKYEEAHDILNSHGLNMGFVTYDSTLVTSEDSAAAFVYKQTPAYDTVNTVRKGQAFNIFMTIDSNKLPQLELLISDSLIIDKQEEE